MPFLLHQPFERSAQQFPDKVAVIDRQRAIGYRALDEQANQLAAVLRANGVKKGDRVGIYLKKSIEAIAGILGVLKAEAVYVPLDPAAPPRRIAFIVGNCDMKGLVSNVKQVTSLQPELESAGGQSLACIVCADEVVTTVPGLDVTLIPWGELAVYEADISWQPVAPVTIEDDLAYILYTSGSTGAPKGVMLSHRAALTFVNWMFETFAIVESDRVSSHAPFHFDLSIFDLFTTFKAGGTVVLVPESYSVFPRNLSQFIAEQEISVWYSVPSVLTRLVLYGNLEGHVFPRLRMILFAGEVFPTKYLRRLMGLLPGVGFFNLYGPTETNVCTYYEVPALSPDQNEPISIGKACANSGTFVVNDQGQLAQPGEIGELYVRGPSLLKGYWGLPERTAKSLVSHPFNPLWDEKAYRTGDLVREEPDGNYTFLGRRDHQIKSRGYRIELGEIETAIYSHLDVEETAVVAIPDEEIGNHIKAFVRLYSGSTLTTNGLEAHCAERIPKYMLPTMIEFRDALPKTSTGKINRPLLVEQHLAQKR